jgi:hypothetical protein
VGILVRTGEVTPEEIGTAVARVLASDEFGNSKRLRRFLGYIVEQSLVGEFDGVKEYNIALEVFDRPPSFNPATDTIVRVEARRLRQQLAAYYHGAGRLDPVVIEMPRGGYLPAFRYRESGGLPSQEGRLPRRRILAVLAAAVSMIAVGFVLRRAGVLPGDRVPHAWVLEGSTLRVLDVHDRLCWEKHFGPFDASFNVLAIDKALIADIDGDGRPEVLFNLPPQGESRGSLLCFEQDGTLRWQFRYGAQKNFGARTFDACYRGALLRPVHVNGKRLLLTVANHYIWYPSQVALLDPKDARVVEEYWHPGSIYHCVIHDMDGDGTEEAVFAAINNPGQGLGHPAVGVLTLPFSKAPRRTFAPDDPLRPLTGGGELFYALLPTPDVNRAMGMLPVPVSFKVDRNRIVTETPVPETGGIVYSLDYELKVMDYRFSDNVTALHQRFFLQHLLDHPLKAQETESLGNVVRFAAAPDGNSAALRRFWKF